jgi:hypothetical protein
MERELPRCRKVVAPPGYRPTYQGHAGAYTGGLNGAYFVEILERYPDGSLLIRNMHDVGKIKCPKVQATIESDLVYPLLRGRSVSRWRYEPQGHILVLQDRQTQKGFPVEWLQRTHPLTWAYVRRFENLLRERKAFKKFFDPAKDAFYSMYAIADYTFAPYKVAWMDISATTKAVVISSGDPKDLVIPEHTVMFLTTDSEDEAHYVAAILNSDIVDTVISGYIVDNHVSTHPTDNVRIPRYDSSIDVHRRLTALSREAHRAKTAGEDRAVRAAEKEIDKVVHALW